MRVWLSALVAAAMIAAPAYAQSVSAILEPAELVEIRSSVAGRVEVVNVTDGAKVASGDVLAEMDSSVQKSRVRLSQLVADAQGAVQRADIAIAQASQLQSRLASAFKKGAAKQWELTQAEQAVELAKADKQVALDQVARNRGQLALDQATLQEFQMSAPFDGTVLQVFVDAGEIVDTSEILMEVGNLSRLSASAFVPFDWVSSMAVGDTVRVELDTGQGLDAEIKVIDPRIDPASQSVRVKLEIANPDGKLFAGMSLLMDRP